jgi:translation elongation factor EF-G
MPGVVFAIDVSALEACMDAPEDAFAQAERHIREGEACIARQIALIEKLDRNGHELADTARELLKTFQNVLKTWRADLVWIEHRHRRGV